jgi:myo-inositol-1(or 4)-monophosphatase
MHTQKAPYVMNTNSTGLSGYENTLHELADHSARVILPFFRSNLEVQEKHGKGMFDPVTEADREAEKIMRELITEHFPEHGIIGEEFGNKNPEAELCWIFDPIDGTRAFIIGAPTWGTLIGLLYNGQPQLGMMNQPFTGERFWGGAKGAFYRHHGGEITRLATSRVHDLQKAILSTTAPEHFADGKDWKKFQSLSGKTRMTRYGYDCYAYCLLSMGLVDLVAEAGLAIYDIAPLIPIVRAAGGVVTTWQNGDPTQGGAILASANQQLHDQALAILSQDPQHPASYT